MLAHIGGRLGPGWILRNPCDGDRMLIEQFDQNQSGLINGSRNAGIGWACSGGGISDSGSIFEKRSQQLRASGGGFFC